MPIQLARFVLAIGAVAAALILSGAGAGIALADPDGSSNTTDTGTSAEASDAPAPPDPTVIPAPMPRSLSERLHDMLHRPLSIFGNGRVPGHRPTTGVSVPDAPKADGRNDEPQTVGVLPRKPAAPEPMTRETFVPLPKSTSNADVQLPFTPAFSVPLPTVPGTDGLQLSIDLTDPYAAYATVDETFNTFNSLLADAYAPFDPTPPPSPEPSFRITEEEPHADADGSVVDLFSVGSDGDLPVLRAPIVPPGVTAPPRGFPAPVRADGARPEATGVGPAGGEVAPGSRGPVTPNGSVQAESLPGGTAAPRQGYPQYLRSPHIGELAVLALPGLVGLLAITASGGMVGYRQANAGRHLHEHAVRFMR